MDMTPEEIVRGVCRDVSLRDVAKIAPYFHEDIVFMNVGLEVCRGREAMLDHYAGAGGAWETCDGRFDFIITDLAVIGNKVLTERVDIVGVKGVEAPLPLMGIFEIEDGKIRYWRDYSDMGMIGRLMKGEQLAPEDGFPDWVIAPLV